MGKELLIKAVFAFLVLIFLGDWIGDLGEKIAASMDATARTIPIYRDLAKAVVAAVILALPVWRRDLRPTLRSRLNRSQPPPNAKRRARKSDRDASAGDGS